MLTLEILEPSPLRFFLSGEYSATKLSRFHSLSTQLEHHHFSAALAELNSTANPQLIALPQFSSSQTLCTDHIEDTVILLLRACSFSQQRVYPAVAQKHQFLYSLII
jgi:hypothetical protein